MQHCTQCLNLANRITLVQLYLLVGGRRSGKESEDGAKRWERRRWRKCAIVHFRVRREKCELLNVTELDEHTAGRVVQFFKRNMGGRLISELQRNIVCSKNDSNFNALKREGKGRDKEKWIISFEGENVSSAFLNAHRNRPRPFGAIGLR